MTILKLRRETVRLACVGRDANYGCRPEYNLCRTVAALLEATWRPIQRRSGGDGGGCGEEALRYMGVLVKDGGCVRWWL